MTKYQFQLTSSLEKIPFKKPECLPAFTSGSMLKNEIFSFQLAAWVHDANEQRVFCRLKIESELAPYIEVKRIGYVPALLPTIEIDDDDDYITKTPGIFPDPLYPLKDNVIELAHNQTRGFWISVGLEASNPESTEGAAPGNYPIHIEISDMEGEVIETLCFHLEIIDAQLPKLDIYNTCWFHGDCLAKLHNLEILSEEYWALLEKYLQVYVKFGHNMILTPIFTPPLDTAVGGERPTNQLVGVSLSGGKYSFDFANLKRFIALCRSCGVEYFEISHLFTQWGAGHAPKIMADVDGTYRRIFGWDTDAASAEYVMFLDAFLPCLVAFLESEGILQNCKFHVSDEPHSNHLESYKAAKALLVKHLDENMFIDALSEYDFYKNGIVTHPVVSNNRIHTFMEKGAEGLWTYYCMAQRKDVANRFIAMPSYRNRILGAQLYKNAIRGFLHWGFNFWFTQHSKEVLNPYQDTCSGGGFPSGDAFVVYPTDTDGNVICSLRLYVFHEGLQDLRALKLLEALTDRDTVSALLEEIDGFKVYPRNADYILELRRKVNCMIKEMS